MGTCSKLILRGRRGGCITHGVGFHAWVYLLAPLSQAWDMRHIQGADTEMGDYSYHFMALSRVPEYVSLESVCNFVCALGSKEELIPF